METISNTLPNTVLIEAGNPAVLLTVQYNNNTIYTPNPKQYVQKRGLLRLWVETSGAVAEPPKITSSKLSKTSHKLRSGAIFQTYELDHPRNGRCPFHPNHPVMADARLYDQQNPA
jgi:hypothetical protein